MTRVGMLLDGTVLGPLAVAASVGDVFGSVVGVVLALTGLALAFMGLCAVIEGARTRGLLGVAIGLGLLAGGLLLTGFLP